MTRSTRFASALALAALCAAGPAPARAGTCADPANAGECRAVCPNLASCVECCHGEGISRVDCAAVCARGVALAGAFDSAQDETCNAVLESSSRGAVVGDFDPATRRLDYYVVYGNNPPEYSDGVLQGGAETASHFHGPASPGQGAGVQLATSVGNPKSGSAILNPTQAGQLQSGLWYHNLHSGTCPAGEIRAQLTPRAAPSGVPFSGPIGSAALAALLALLGALALARAARAQRGVGGGAGSARGKIA